MDRSWIRNEWTGDWIARSFEGTEIASGIPEQCQELLRLSRSSALTHGPHALVAIRNDLVHSDPKLGPISADTYAEARNLGQWYIELLLLHLFGYSGRYYNRLRDKEGIHSGSRRRAVGREARCDVMTSLTESDVENPTLTYLAHIPDIAATLRSNALSGCNRTIRPTSIENDALCIS